MNRILTDLESGVASFRELLPDNLDDWMLAIAEESGEVIGAFNKWHKGRISKTCTMEDVVEEMSQLMANLFCTADLLGVPPAELLDMTGDFFEQKTRQVKKMREEKCRG